MKIRVRYFIPLIFLFLFFQANSQEFDGEKSDEKIYKTKSEWVDSLMDKLTIEEKIGQLFMVAAWSNKGEDHKREITNLVEKHNLGGLIFFQGTPYKQAKLTNYYQSRAKIPLLISIDGEWGLSMRLDSTMAFPRQMTLGAIRDDTLIYEMGREVARQVKRLGMQVNLAPVVDINNNPNNPVIHTRSFGENKKTVTASAMAYMEGMQDEKVLAVAKHFPGHGDTDKDSHKSLPIIPHDKKRLDTLELFPFRELINEGLGGIMSAHLYIPAYEKRENMASSLSEPIVSDLLRKKLDFPGLIFTDALNMKGVSGFHKPGEVDLMALKAGNDVLLFSENVPLAIEKIKASIEDGEISEKELNHHVERILTIKYWSGVYKSPRVAVKGLYQDLHTPRAKTLKRKLIENALTLVKNDDVLVPVKKLRAKKIASVALGAGKDNKFQQTLKLYSEIDAYNLPQNSLPSLYREMVKRVEGNNLVIISLHGMSLYNVHSFGLSPNEIAFVNEISQKKDVILVVFGSPYSLRLFEGPKAILQAYEDDSDFQDLAAQAIFGGIPLSGKLPVSVEGKFKEGTGIIIRKPVRLKYTLPEDVGINSKKLRGIDSIINLAIEKKATPGAQILVAKDGKVFYHKAFGYQTYKKDQRVDPMDLYDLASITKVASTMLAVMRFYDLGLLDIDKTLGFYLANLPKEKSILPIKEVLTHQAGLTSWIPFYKFTLNPQGFCDSNYCYDPNEFFSVKVADGLYLNEGYRDSMWNIINNTEIKNRGEYKYSDLGFFYMKRIIDTLIKRPFNYYLDNNFYEPIGMNRTTFLPLEKFSSEVIVPSEVDNYFRRQELRGNVHDMAAAMLGGVAGHAGLFGNANDLAKLLQMLLNNGNYGGERYFSWPTIDKFTTQQFPKNRKGLGFDKPEPDPDKISPTSILASPETFGHTGFTGTAMWADPEYDLIFVFLSNRVYPTMENRKLIEMDTRTEIQRVIYESFLPKEKIKNIKKSREQ